MCNASLNEKVLGGGYIIQNPLPVVASYPSNETTWEVRLLSSPFFPNDQVYAVCSSAN